MTGITLKVLESLFESLCKLKSAGGTITAGASARLAGLLSWLGFLRLLAECLVHLISADSLFAARVQDSNGLWQRAHAQLMRQEQLGQAKNDLETAKDCCYLLLLLFKEVNNHLDVAEVMTKAPRRRL